MNKPRIISNEAAIVLIGNFNPGIFHPSWFSSNNLIKKEEEQKAIKNLKMINNNITSFSADWLSVIIEPERFQVLCNQEPAFEASRDLTIGTFRILAYTPIKKMGINRHIKYKIATKDDWNALGFKLVPKENWDGILNEYVGMKNLEVQGNRTDNYDGNIQVKVTPLDSEQHIVIISVNDHFDLNSSKNSPEESLEILNNEWSASMDRSKNIIETIIHRRGQ